MTNLRHAGSSPVRRSPELSGLFDQKNTRQRPDPPRPPVDLGGHGKNGSIASIFDGIRRETKAKLAEIESAAEKNSTATSKAVENALSKNMKKIKVPRIDAAVFSVMQVEAISGWFSGPRRDDCKSQKRGRTAFRKARGVAYLIEVGYQGEYSSKDPS
jgi:hypothetical protein